MPAESARRRPHRGPWRGRGRRGRIGFGQDDARPRHPGTARSHAPSPADRCDSMARSSSATASTAAPASAERGSPSCPRTPSGRSMRCAAAQMRRPLELHRGLLARSPTSGSRACWCGLASRTPDSSWSAIRMSSRAACCSAPPSPQRSPATPSSSSRTSPTRARRHRAAPGRRSFLALVRDLDTSLLVISHDLRLLGRMADRIAAMYAGRIVEFGPADRLLRQPRHPYLAALLAASVRSAPPGEHLPVIAGQPPALPGTFAPALSPRGARVRTHAAGRRNRGTPGRRWKARPAITRSSPARPSSRRRRETQALTPKRWRRDGTHPRTDTHDRAAALGPAHRDRVAPRAGGRRHRRALHLVGRPDVQNRSRA